LQNRDVVVDGLGPETRGCLADVFDGTLPVQVEVSEQGFLSQHSVLLEVFLLSSILGLQRCGKWESQRMANSER
jgi:hypothetical protein